MTNHGETVLRNPVLSAMHYGFVYARGQNGRISILDVINKIRTRYLTISNINTQYYTIGYGFADDPHIREWGFSIISRQWFEKFFAAEDYGIIEYLEQGSDNQQD
jgi:hypothetical protein